jgi:hypothetical protein
MQPQVTGLMQFFSVGSVYGWDSRSPPPLHSHPSLSQRSSIQLPLGRLRTLRLSVSIEPAYAPAAYDLTNFLWHSYPFCLLHHSGLLLSDSTLNCFRTQTSFPPIKNRRSKYRIQTYKRIIFLHLLPSVHSVRVPLYY